MNAIYDSFTQLGIRMLREFGVDATLLKPGPVTGPAHRPVIGDPVPHTIRVFQSTKEITSISDPTISVVKNKLLVSSIGSLRIEDSDKIQTPAGVFVVKKVREVAPVFTTILWIVEIGA